MFTFHVETDSQFGKGWDYELEVTAKPGWYDPGISSGPVEVCYPPDGEPAEVSEVLVTSTIAPNSEEWQSNIPTPIEDYMKLHKWSEKEVNDFYDWIAERADEEDRNNEYFPEDDYAF